MKIIIAPDKFKGSLTSRQAGECISNGIRQANMNAEVKIFPMADGGDGFAAVMKHYLQTQTIECETTDALMRGIAGCYEWDATSKTAIIELASASGLAQLNQEEQNPLRTSTYGTGVMIQQAINQGAQKIILGLGGSATNDGGIGILSGLGFVFKDENEKQLPPTGENLQHIQSVIAPSPLPAIEFIVACDVTNTLVGKEGAAYIFAPQKGADENAVAVLDKGLRNFAAVIQLQTRKDISNFPGSGAAGGVAAGLFSFFNIQIVSGAAFIAKISGIENQLLTASLIITGEGKADNQTSKGKVVQYIASLGKEYDVPVVVFCGQSNLSAQEIKAMGLASVHSLANGVTDNHTAIKNAGVFLPALVEKYFKPS